MIFTDYTAIRVTLRHINRELTHWGGINRQWEKFWALLIETRQENTESITPVPKSLPYMTASIRQQRNLKKRHWKSEAIMENMSKPIMNEGIPPNNCTITLGQALPTKVS